MKQLSELKNIVNVNKRVIEYYKQPDRLIELVEDFIESDNETIKTKFILNESETKHTFLIVSKDKDSNNFSFLIAPMSLWNKLEQVRTLNKFLLYEPFMTHLWVRLEREASIKNQVNY